MLDCCCSAERIRTVAKGGDHQRSTLLKDALQASDSGFSGQNLREESYDGSRLVSEDFAGCLAICPSRLRCWWQMWRPFGAADGATTDGARRPPAKVDYAHRSPLLKSCEVAFLAMTSTKNGAAIALDGKLPINACCPRYVPSPKARRPQKVKSPRHVAGEVSVGTAP